MSDRREDENSGPVDNGPAEAGPGNTESAGSDRDLRSLLGGSSPSRTSRPSSGDYRPVERRAEPPAEPAEPSQLQEPDEEAPIPYEPPVRDEEGRPIDVQPPAYEDRPEPTPPARPEESQNLPPVWPGDENQPWFRKERGLPPLPDDPGADGSTVLDPEDLPTPLADIPTKGRAWGVSVLLPNVVGLIPTIGILFGTVFLVVNLFLFRQGQDIGAVVFRLRVVRENGDVAGFFQMFVRNAASTISLLVLGAGYWSAFSDPYRRTWHDKWLGTYVVKDSEEYNTRRRSSSSLAFNWFWVIVLLLIAAVLLVWLSGPVPTETTTPTNGGGGGGTAT